MKTFKGGKKKSEESKKRKKVAKVRRLNLVPVGQYSGTMKEERKEVPRLTQCQCLWLWLL
jgi:hypothetical protein